VSALRRLVVAWSSAPRTRRRTKWAWIIGSAAPALIAAASLPFRSSLGLAGELLLTLLAVAATSVLGGVRPALACVAVGVLAGAFLLAPPYGALRVDLEADLAALIAFVVVGVGIAFLVDELAGLADEQAALKRVATLVGRAAPPDEIFAAIAEEVGRRLPVDITHLNCYAPEGRITVVAGWSPTGDQFPVGSRFALGGNDLSTLVAETGRPARIDRFAGASGEIAAAARSIGTGSAVGTPIVVAGRLWGVMSVVSIHEKPLPRDTEERLARFTDLLATAIANAESRTELAASRARVVSAADDGRRRIERDLHDGVQQRLVSLGLELRTAEDTVPPDLTDLKSQLSDVSLGLGEALDDLQEISRGIHPAVLAKGGLGPAINALARRSAVPVELDLRAEGRLPERVEVAAYYIVSEALTNAAKHANASVVHVDIRRGAGGLQLSIRDDGCGGAEYAHGSGLIGLRDRVDALGGQIELTSVAGSGTSLTATIPVTT
jgi:signal transduction histidine kinase